MKLKITNTKTDKLVIIENKLWSGAFNTNLENLIAPFLNEDNTPINDIKIEVEKETYIEDITLICHKEEEKELAIDPSHLLGNILSEELDNLIYDEYGTNTEVEDFTLEDYIYINVNTEIKKEIEIDKNSLFIEKTKLETKGFLVNEEVNYHIKTYEVKELNTDHFIKWVNENPKEELPEE